MIREPSLRFAPENPLTEITLIISITCSTINPPASLRSDRLIGFDKISDRFRRNPHCGGTFIGTGA
jgi:hypothetical protein